MFVLGFRVTVENEVLHVSLMVRSVRACAVEQTRSKQVEFRTG